MSMLFFSFLIFASSCENSEAYFQCNTAVRFIYTQDGISDSEISDDISIEKRVYTSTCEQDIFPPFYEKIIAFRLSYKKEENFGVF